MAERYDVPVVFSAPKKLSALCRKINDPEGKSDECKKKHQNKFVECHTGVVYDIPLSCGRSYVGQTGRCVNDRAREHAASLKQSPSGHLAVHCNRCECTPVFNDVAILGRYSKKITREIHEAYAIRKGADKCISEPSVTLSEKECLFLDKEWARGK